MTLYRYFCGAAFVLLSLHSQAQRVIPLQEAVLLALQNNATLRLSTDRIALADAKFRQVKEKSLPQIGSSLQVSRLSVLSPFELSMGGPEPAFALPPSSFWATIGLVSASKEIFSGFAEKSAHKSAELLTEATRLDAEKDRREIEYGVVASYYNIYKIMKSAQILEENMKLLDRKEQEVQNMLREGVLTSNELLKIQLQKSNLELSKVDVANAQKTALFNLATLLGLSEEVAVDTTLALGKQVHGKALELIEQAQTTRPELKANAVRMKVAENALIQTRSILYPHVDASAMYIYLNPNKNVIPASHTFLQALNLGVSVKYSISSLYASKGRIQEAKLNIAQAQHGNQIQQEQIRNEVFGLYTANETALEKVHVSEKALAQADRSYQLTDSKFRNGLLLSSDLLEAQSLLLQSQLNLLSSRVDAQLNYYKLQKALGNPIQ
ncbi:TolC family protein [Siphonobacter sp. SORGH_AS_0500]|uniref:TolC family protein n=1 Tax=Siphonobacter sp. SORGH_AS_0500 TaxID=1864824 RepID=UPI00285A14C2|nr:TolC family protein [Siphonobacter sp. SORGH_AS_0500]MDR6196922.1 outer membrane protein [Siphonobacter sp. SORGH_AS_0500]